MEDPGGKWQNAFGFKGKYAVKALTLDRVLKSESWRPGFYRGLRAGQRSLQNVSREAHHEKSNEGALRPRMAAALLLVLFRRNSEVEIHSQTTE